MNEFRATMPWRAGHDLVLFASRGKYAGLLAVSIAFALIGALLVVAGGAVRVTVGVVSIAFFGLGALVFARQLLDRRPRIVIDANGVFDRTLRVGCIPWADIRDAYARSLGTSDFVCLVLHDPARWTRELPALSRAFLDGNRKLGFEALNINLSGVAVEPSRVLEAVRARCHVPATD